MKKFILSLSVLLLLSSCVETVIVASVAGAVVVTREKTLVETKNDVIIAAKIDKEFLVNGLKTPKNSVEVMVNEGRVLLIGTIRELDKGRKAGEIAWKVKGVKEIIDEIQIDGDALKASDLFASTVDTFTTSKIKTKLFFSRKTTAADFKIKTENGVVYILGVAKNNSELSETLRLIASTSGVKKVVNHAILLNDSRRKS
jgi:osmotically-inducible protein OsmY